MAKATTASVLLVAALISLVMSVSLADQGTASYSTAGTPSACLGNPGEGAMIAAASDALWDNGTACGRMYKVTCIGATNAAVDNPCNAGTSVTVTIVDLCPSPACQVTFDLSQQAFSTIANLAAGEILIDYELA